ncbi:hypothetical protein EIP91_000360 [Steccherinum ochraceum]|uniref:Uncharacterized protein n=1 Tax=Steccherinum ochraceum TaxID=92696 RepID=A0A4R0RG64_9APHY|nr:hypothetical protein EIP91_000360 [Steccherinum ochraceum]
MCFGLPWSKHGVFAWWRTHLTRKRRQPFSSAPASNSPSVSSAGNDEPQDTAQVELLNINDVHAFHHTVLEPNNSLWLPASPFESDSNHSSLGPPNAFSDRSIFLHFPLPDAALNEERLAVQGHATHHRFIVPFDIWYLVMEAIPTSPDNYNQTTEDLRTLLSCALTCREWRIHAEKILKRFKPSRKVVLRSGADLTALPRTTSYRRSITRLTLSPASLTDQGWVTAALLSIAPGLKCLKKLYLDNLNLRAQHPSFYRAWSLTCTAIRKSVSRTHPSKFVMCIKRIHSPSGSRLAHLLRHFKLCIGSSDSPSGHITDEAPQPSDEDFYDLTGYHFEVADQESLCSWPNITVSVQLNNDRDPPAWRNRLSRILGRYDSIYNHRLWDLEIYHPRVADGQVVTFDNKIFSTIMQRCPYLHSLTLSHGCGTPEGSAPWNTFTAYPQSLTLRRSGTLRQMAWLKSSSGASGAPENDYPILNFDTLNTLDLSRLLVLSHSAFETLVRLIQLPNITSLSLDSEVIRWMYDALPTCSSLKHVALTMWPVRSPKFWDVESGPRIFVKTPFLQSLKLELVLQDDWNLNGLDWICDNLADCVYTLHYDTIHIAFNLLSPLEEMRLFSAHSQWSRLELALLADNLGEITFEVLTKYPSQQFYHSFKAHLIQELPTLVRRSCFRFSGEDDEK